MSVNLSMVDQGFTRFWEERGEGTRRHALASKEMSRDFEEFEGNAENVRLDPSAPAVLYISNEEKKLKQRLRSLHNLFFEVY